MAPPPFRGGSCFVTLLLFITLLLAVLIGIVSFCVRASARLSQVRSAKFVIWSVTTSLQLAPFSRTKTQEEVRTSVQGYSFLTQSCITSRQSEITSILPVDHQTCCNKWNEGHSCVQRHAMNSTGCVSVWSCYWEDELPDMLAVLPYTAIKAAHWSWATPRLSLGNWLLCILVSLGSEEEQACFDVLHK